MRYCEELCPNCGLRPLEDQEDALEQARQDVGEVLEVFSYSLTRVLQSECELESRVANLSNSLVEHGRGYGIENVYLVAQAAGMIAANVCEKHKIPSVLTGKGE